VLDDKLDDVAWATFAGGFALSVALPSVPGLGTVQAANRLVYDLPPGELERLNDEKLTGADVSPGSRKSLFLNGHFTPTLQTELVEAIVSLGPVEGRDAVVALAAKAASEGDARYVRRAGQLLAAGVGEVGGWKAVGVTDDDIEARSADGRIVLAWAADYMTWNEGTIPHSSPAIAAAKVREIWIPGIATARARSELRALGFEVREKRPLR